MDFKDLLVVIPHSGILIPQEIPLNSLSNEFHRLVRDVDWHTNRLYDSRDILGNKQVEFPYCSLILEANRDPDNLEESVPLQNRLGESLYKRGMEPDQKTRQQLAQKYLLPFHRGITRNIARGNIMFMLDGHSTVTSQGVKDNQIELMNYQVSARDGGKTCFCPDMLIEIYAGELTQQLPETNVTVNQSRYDRVYGHVCGRHSVNSIRREGNRVPAILQETNQKLYMNADRTPNIEAIETLRRAFACALTKTMETVRRLNGGH